MYITSELESDMLPLAVNGTSFQQQSLICHNDL